MEHKAIVYIRLRPSCVNRKYITHRNDAGGRRSHGHRQHTQKFGKIAHVVTVISSRTDRHAHRRSRHNTSQQLLRSNNSIRQKRNNEGGRGNRGSLYQAKPIKQQQIELTAILHTNTDRERERKRDHYKN